MNPGDKIKCVYVYNDKGAYYVTAIDKIYTLNENFELRRHEGNAYYSFSTGDIRSNLFTQILENPDVWLYELRNIYFILVKLTDEESVPVISGDTILAAIPDDKKPPNTEDFYARFPITVSITMDEYWSLMGLEE